MASRRRCVPTADGQKASSVRHHRARGRARHRVCPATPTWSPSTGRPGTAIPSRCVERDGRLYGRGTSDMKGFLACVLAMVPDFTRARLKTPIHLAFSYDEEVGCTRRAPDDRRVRRRLPTPAPGHRRRADVDGASSMRTRVPCAGRSRSPAAPRIRAWPISASTRSRSPARCIGELRRIEDELKRNPPDARFDPPYPTLQVTHDRRRHRHQHRAGIMPLLVRRARHARPRRRCRSSGACGISRRPSACPQMQRSRAGSRDHHRPA